MLSFFLLKLPFHHLTIQTDSDVVKTFKSLPYFKELASLHRLAHAHTVMVVVVVDITCTFVSFRINTTENS